MKKSLRIFLLAGALPAAAFLPCIAGHAATTERVSVSSTGEQGNDWSESPSISADGRFVAFWSLASNLVPGNGSGLGDVYVRDRLTGTTECVSVSSSGEAGILGSVGPSISADGRFVAFYSEAHNLVPVDANLDILDVFLRDRLTGVTEMVSVSTSGEQGNLNSEDPAISADGRFVAFWSYATNLVPDDTNGPPGSEVYGADVFVRDRLIGTTERVSVSSSGEQGDSGSGCAAISADGRFVAFGSGASNLVPGDTNGKADIFLRDTQTGITELVSMSSSGEQGNGDSHCRRLSISADGRFVAFKSTSTNLVPGDSFYPSVSADGRFVAFHSYAADLVAGDVNNKRDVFIRDRQTGVTELVSASSWGEHGDNESYDASISPDGRLVAFVSGSSNLVPGDTNRTWDVFLRDRGASPPSEPHITINAGASCTNSTTANLLLTFAQGYDEMRLRNDPGDWGPWEPSVAQRSWTLPAGDGVKAVCMQCRDGFGNLSDVVCDDILLDTTPPSNLWAIINDGAPCTGQASVYLRTSATGASEMRFSNDGQAWSPWRTDGYWTLSGIRGLKTVSVQWRDPCGNESAVVSDDIWWVLFDDVGCRNSQRVYVEALAQHGIVSACSTSPPLYCPTADVSRAQMAEVLCRAAGKAWLDKAMPTFADVPRTHPAYGWIERLADSASWGGTPVTDGCRLEGAQRYFCPDASVTRAHAAKLLCRATGRSPMPSCSGTFADVTSVNLYCGYIERLAEAASWPSGVAVTNGCKKVEATRSYCPYSPLTRGQMAVFLVRAFGIPL